MLGTATGALAQEWATYDYCRFTSVEITAEGLAPDSQAELREAAKDIPNGLGKLWRITAPSGAISHLWGTMHSNDPLLLQLPDRLKEIITNADTVAIEIDARWPSRKAMADDPYYELRYDPDGISAAPAGVEQELLRWIDRRFLRDSADYGSIWSTTRPAGILEYLLADPCNDFHYGVYPIQDDRILMLGQIGGATTLGLEDRDDFIQHLSKPENAALTTAMIRVFAAYLDPEPPKARRETLAGLYRTGQVGMMMAWDRSHIRQYFGTKVGDQLLAMVDGYLLAERNAIFMERAEAFLNTGASLIAVGAFHLPGQDGLIEGFRKRGYTVERIPLDEEVP